MRWSVVALLSISVPGRGEDVRINAPRPVAEAVERLQERLGVPITYEEAPYYFAGDIEDVTEKIAKPEALAHERSVGEPPRTIMGMKSRELHFSYLPDARTNVEIKRGIQNALNGNNSASPPIIFEVKEVGGRFHVYPSKVRNVNGEYIAYKPLLDTIISLERKERTDDEFEYNFCGALVSATNTSIFPNTGGFSWPNSFNKTTLGGTNVVARELLVQYLSAREARPLARRGKYSWSFLCGTGSPPCALNVYLVKSQLSNQAGSQQGPAKAQAVSEPPPAFPPKTPDARLPVFGRPGN